MKIHQLRLICEQMDLDDRRLHLALFIGGDTYATLEAAEQSRLKEQLEVMGKDSQILTDRIAALSL